LVIVSATLAYVVHLHRSGSHMEKSMHDVLDDLMKK
jgi:hypothetical protein